MHFASATDLIQVPRLWAGVGLAIAAMALYVALDCVLAPAPARGFARWLTSLLPGGRAIGAALVIAAVAIAGVVLIELRCAEWRDQVCVSRDCMKHDPDKRCLAWTTHSEPCQVCTRWEFR